MPRWVSGDEVHLRQVLANLLNNAVKFTNDGEVLLTVSTVANAHGVEDLIRFEVSDTGCGISDDKLDRLFKTFSQVDSSTTRKFGGTGLGLAISKRLVTLMEGEIGVTSAPGRGSVFWIEMRLESAHDPEKDGYRITRDCLSDLRVLIIDDNKTQRRVLEEQCRGWGVTPTTVTNIDEGMTRLHEAARDLRTFEVVVVETPGTNPEDLGKVASLRLVERHESVKIILLTEIDRHVSGELAATSRFNGVLMKPLRPSDLFDALVNAISGHDVEPRRAPAPARFDLSISGNRSGRVLLVEDQEINQLVATEILKEAGVRHDVVSNGREAIAAVQSTKYALVLMDCQMPEMGGFEATRRIREAESKGERTDRLPIVALTANAVKGDRERCLEAGMDDYLSKPIDPQLLIETVDSHLDIDAAQPVTTSASMDDPATTDDVQRIRALPGSPIDVDQLLRRCMNNAKIAQKVLTKLDESLDRVRTEVLDLIESRNLETLEKQAHALKGVAGNAAATELHSIAAELEDEFRIGNHVILTGGLRFDSFESSKSRASPRASIIVLPDSKTAIKLRYGEAFRAPTYQELYTQTVDNEDEGNPSLDPQAIRTAEIETSRFLGDHHRARATFFHTHFEDFIKLPRDGGFQNLDDREFYGVEVDVSGRIVKDLSYFANYTLTQAEEFNDANIAGVPEHMGNAGLTYTGFKYLDISMHVRVVGHRNGSPEYQIDVPAANRRNLLGSYTTLNLTLLSKNVPGPFDMSLSIRNLLDETYHTPGEKIEDFDILQPGLRVLFALSMRF